MRKLLAVLVFFTVCATFSFAAPVVSAKANVNSSTKIYGAVEAKAGFAGGRLFDVLDSVGGSGTWME